jgi:hypothetical protein
MSERTVEHDIQEFLLLSLVRKTQGRETARARIAACGKASTGHWPAKERTYTAHVKAIIVLCLRNQVYLLEHQGIFEMLDEHEQQYVRNQHTFNASRHA